MYLPLFSALHELHIMRTSVLLLSRSGTMDSKRADSICQTPGYVIRISAGVGRAREASAYPDLSNQINLFTREQYELDKESLRVDEATTDDAR